MHTLFIGAGRMGEALIKGVLKSGVLTKDELFLFEKDMERAAYIKNKYEINCFKSLQKSLESVEIIIIAIKPQQLAGLIEELNRCSISGKVIVSIAAGISVKFYKDRLKEEVSIIRVMPNILATIGESVSAISPSENISENIIKEVKKIFLAVGKIITIEEKFQNAVTALSGSGPAYFYLFAEAMTESGIRAGLSRETALRLVYQTMKGSQKMLDNSGKHPESLIDEVASPGGTTIAALEVFESQGFKECIFKAVEAAIKRAEELEQS